jgi:hypothetical protein
LGIYGGRITKGSGQYVLELRDELGETIRVDSEGDDSGMKIFSIINEDIHEGRSNMGQGDDTGQRRNHRSG